MCCENPIWEESDHKEPTDYVKQIWSIKQYMQNTNWGNKEMWNASKKQNTSNQNDQILIATCS